MGDKLIQMALCDQREGGGGKKRKGEKNQKPLEMFTRYVKHHKRGGVIWWEKSN